MPRLPLIVITGPTGSGKSQLAYDLARATRARSPQNGNAPVEIIGADSIQIYKHLDVGSAKPSLEERQEFPHHWVDVLEPTESWSAPQYAAGVDQTLQEMQRGARESHPTVPIVVGGSGLWLRALLRGLLPLPEIDPTLRQELEARVQAQGSETLHRELQQRDPDSARAIHANDSLRIVRALEILHATGTPASVLRAQHALGQPRYAAQIVVVSPPWNTLRNSIAQRVDRMLAQGWVQEIQHLVERFGHEIPPLKSVGYRQLLPHVLAQEPLDTCRTAAIKATQTYAKQQRNWWREDNTVTHRYDPSRGWPAHPAPEENPAPAENPATPLIDSLLKQHTTLSAIPLPQSIP